MSVQNHNLFTHFDNVLRESGDKPLLILENGVTYDYKTIEYKSSQIAALFKSINILPGDRISVQVDKSPESLFLYLACLQGGYIYHPLNPSYTANELEFFIENAEPSIIICDVTNLAIFENLAKKNSIKHVFTLGVSGEGTLIDSLDDSAINIQTFNTPKNHIAALLYSSGTTGIPKGIMLTHENLISNTETLVKTWQFTKEDVLMHALPIFHVHGLFVAIGCALSTGASMYWLNKFDPLKVLEHIDQCSVLMGVPTFYTRLLSTEKITHDNCKNMRVFISGSAPLLEETFNDFETMTGHKILERYGMTETNMNTSNPIDGARKPGTVGPPLPGIEIQIVDDEGKKVGDNVIGNLLVRGPNVFKGYWKMPEKTAEDFTAQGFFKTGDKAKIDADGYISIVGRSKDMIITGGLNVYPKEIELIIDDIQGVKESAVIGVYHKDFGEAVVAIVICSATSALKEIDIIEYCKQHLAGYKIPKKVIFANELPRNTMSKVQKNILRENHKNSFNL